MHAGIVLFGRKRPGFDSDWGQEMMTAIQKAATMLPFKTMMFPKVVNDEQSLAETLCLLAKEEVDTLAVSQPTMSDGRLILRLAQEWNRPLVLWATPERPDSDRVSSCSLVGTHVFAANLRQHGFLFELVYGDPKSSETLQELQDAFTLCHAAAKLPTAKIGLIGYHAPGFVDMHVDPAALMDHFGVTLWHTGIQEILDRMATIPTVAVQADLDSILAMGLPLESVHPTDLEQNSRFFLAIKKLVEEERLDAIAIREWPELPNLTGSWPYVALSRLLDEGYPIVCEGDVDGALTSLLGQCLGLGTGYLSDWLAHDTNSIVLWHGGCAPLSLCVHEGGGPIRPYIGTHFNSDKPAVINAVIAPDQPMTLCRIWRCDYQYFLMTAQGITRNPPQIFKGTTGYIHMEGLNVPNWFKELCYYGMPHHITAFPGHVTPIFRRVAQLLKLKIL